jgi:hypothetical protein
VYDYYPTHLPPKRLRRDVGASQCRAIQKPVLEVGFGPFPTRPRCHFEDQSDVMDVSENRSNPLAIRTVCWETQSRDGSDEFRKDGATLDAVARRFGQRSR